MRKEVKLGMGIGGGVVAILVVYLLVAPPGTGKKGVQLVGAGGNGNGNLVDPSQTGDQPPPNLGNVEQPPVNGNALVEASLKKTEGQATTSQQTASQQASKLASGNAAPGRDQWTAALEKGKAQPPGTTAVNATTGQADAGAKAMAKNAEPSRTAVAEAPNNRGQAQTHMYFDPNGAWGGGVSNDATARVPAKGGLIAGSSPAKGGAALVEASPIGRNSHVVRSGETFSSIAQAAYGSAAYYPHVLRANPNLNPSALRPGMVIHLPPVEEVKASAAAEKAAEKSGAATADAPAGAKLVEEVKIDSSRQYRVVSGDSLYKIGQKLYGKGLMGDKIYEVNRQVIGSDPKRLKLGMILELPEPPTVGRGASASKSQAPQGGRSTPGSLEEAWNTSSSSEPFFGNDSDPK